jgi:hypothetical protein
MATLALEIHVVCPKCTTSVPVNALVSHVTCSGCQAEVALDKLQHELRRERFWARLMLGRSVSADDLSLKGDIAWGEPLCPGCKAVLPLPADLEAASRVGHISCPACASQIAVRRVPSELLPAEVTYVTHLIGEDPSLLPGRPGTLTARKSSTPVVFTCPSCNASLPVDGSSRTVECEYCHSKAYLPDDLWRTLHPVQTISRWCLVADAESPRARGYRRANRLNSWSIVFTWVFFLAALGAFFSLATPFRWFAAGALLLGAVFWFFIGIRWSAQSEGETWP